MKQKVITTGNSLAVTVPSQFVKLIGIKPGDQAQVTLTPEKGKISYTFTGIRQLSLTSSLTKASPKS